MKPTKAEHAEVSHLGSESEFQTLVESSVQGIAVHRDFKFLFANGTMAKMLGYSSVAELMELDVLGQVIRPHERADAVAGYQAVLRGVPIDNPIESCILKKDGSEIWVERIHARIRWEGRPALLATLFDITARKTAEIALQKAFADIQRLTERLETENIYLRQKITEQHKFDEFVGESEALKNVFERIERVAVTNATVLIVGESGTGKELVAQAIHHASPRSKGPLVVVNCAAIPEALVESELFGHERGAFTGAVATRQGYFELADKGTIFLDEIGELPLATQSKLLRILQEGEFQRVGGARARKVDARIVAATNRDLAALVKSGAFREDLFYRLNVFPIVVPPLRERREDIPGLALHFIRKHCAPMGRPLAVIPESTMAELSQFPWPGNVRELENVIERALILTDGDTLNIDISAYPGLLSLQGNEIPSAQTLPEMEGKLIREALRACGGVIDGVNGAARKLDIAPSTLRDRIAKYHLTRRS